MVHVRDNDMYNELPLVENVGKLPARAAERPAAAEPENPVRSWLAAVVASGIGTL